MARRTTGEFSEFSAIAELERIFGRPGPRTARPEVAIGDDAAVFAAAGKLVWTVDVNVEGVHFDRRWLSLEAIGWRSFQAAASDLAAMGARPLYALSSIILPAGMSQRELLALARGQQAAALASKCPIVGGNLSRGRELSVTTTLLGRVRRPLLRSGAKPGDELWLLGDVGLAALGLEVLRRGRSRIAGAALAGALAAWRRPQARLSEGLALVGRAHAAIDVSDGLAGDAGHLARASGVRTIIELGALRAQLSPAFHALCGRLGLEAVDLALYGGEDYALLAAGPARRRPSSAKRLGRIERGQGVRLDVEGRLCHVERGFDHFKRSR